MEKAIASYDTSNKTGLHPSYYKMFYSYIFFEISSRQHMPKKLKNLINLEFSEHREIPNEYTQAAFSK